MRIRPLEAADADTIGRLLRENPYKQAQIAFQKLDADRLAGFHRDRSMRRAGSQIAPIWVCQGAAGWGAIGVSKVESHSAFFDILAFSIDFCLTYRLSSPEKKMLVAEAVRWADIQGATVLWARTDEEEPGLPGVLCAAGAEYCGSSVRLCTWYAGQKAGSPVEGIRVRAAVELDREALRRVAGASHEHSHFFRDPFLPEEKKQELFPRYLEKSMGQANRPLLVAESESGELLGFSLLLCPEGQEEQMGRRVGIVDFIAVHPNAQGQGVGRVLLNASFDALAARGYLCVELKTMMDNLNALAFYQKYGFRPVSVEMHFSRGRS